MFDSHAHLTHLELLSQIDPIMERALASGITRLVNVCTDFASLEAGIKLQHTYPQIYLAAATHPHDAKAEERDFSSALCSLAKHLVAIGEIGLDYHYQYSSPQEQKRCLSTYFALAITLNLPVIFHCREAFEDLFAIADGEYRGKKAVLHCFTGTKEEVKKCLDRGWLISFSGVVTFKKSLALQEVVKFVPLDRMLIETDAPYLAPQTKRGKRNEPSYILETAEKIAGIKEISLADVQAATWENASQFFALK